MHPLLGGRIFQPHQRDRLLQGGIVARLAQRLVAKQALVECLMLDPDGREHPVRLEKFASHPADPHRGVGNLRKRACDARLDDEARGIDDRLAGLDLRVEDIAENTERGQLRASGRRDIEPDRARQLAVVMHAENIGVLEVVIFVGKASPDIGLDRIFLPVSVIAKPVNFFSFFRRIGAPVVHALDKIKDTYRRNLD